MQVNKNKNLPEGFFYLSEALPDVKFDVRYATTHNFTGSIVDGYRSDMICATVQACEALKKAASALKNKGYGLLIFDAYRPKRAVDFFLSWAESPENSKTKQEFYPDIQKKDLHRLGYIAKSSSHSRGSAIDLTLYNLSTGKQLDMGSDFDFFGAISNHGTSLITDSQTENRNILKNAMNDAGFKELKTEWWHYRLIKEPFPDKYFDFVIE